MPLTFDDLVPASKVAFDDLIPKSRVSFDDLVPAHPVVAPSTPEEVAQRLGISGAEQLQPEPLIEGARTEETPLVKFPQGAKKFLGEAIARGTLGPIAAALIPEKEKTGVGESILGMAEGMTTPSGLASIPAFMAAPQLLVPEMALHAAKQAGEEFQQGEIGKGMTTFALGAAPLVHSIAPPKSPIGRGEPPPVPEAKPPPLPTSIPETVKVLQESGLIKTETVQPKEPYAIQEQSPDANVLQQERQQVGLQRMGEENAQPEVVAGTQTQAEVMPSVGAAAKAGSGEFGQGTSLKNETGKLERALHGLPEEYPGQTQAMVPAWERAGETLKANPNAARVLLEDLKQNPEQRALSGDESMLILRYKQDLLNAKNDAAEKTFSDDPATKVIGEQDYMRYSNELLDLLDTMKFRGSGAGRELRFRQALAFEDYSFETMRSDKQVALGRKLTDAETAQVKQLHDRIAGLEKQLAEKEAARVTTEREQGTDEVVTETVRRSREEAKSEKATGIERDIPAEKADVISNLKDRFMEQDGSLVGANNSIQKLMELLAREGITERVKMEQAVHDILTKQVDPTITLQETQDLMSGYGKFKPLSKDPIKVVVRGIKGEIQQVRKLLDFFQGLAPSKTGVERRIPTAKERELQKVVNEAKKRFGTISTDPAKALKSALDAIETRLKNRITDLKQEIATRKRIIKERAPTPYNEETIRLRKELEDLQKQWDEIFGKRELTPEERLKRAEKAAERQEEELKRQLRTGEIFPKSKITTEQHSAILDTTRARIEALKEERQWAREAAQPRPEVADAEAAKRSAQLDKQIKDLEEQIRTETVFPKGKKPTTEETAANQARLDKIAALKEERQYIRERLQPREEPEVRQLRQILDRLRKQEISLHERLAKGDFTKRIKKEQPTSPEILDARARVEAAKIAFQKGLRADEMSRWSVGQKIWDGIKKTRGAITNIVSSFDFSAPRQALFTILANSGRVLTNPFGAGRMLVRPFIEMFKAWGSETIAQRIEQRIKDRPNYKSGADKLAKIEYSDLTADKFTKYEENAHSVLDEWAAQPLSTGNLAKTVATAPVRLFARGVRASNRAFVTFLNMTRASLFDELLSKGFPDRAPTKIELEAIGNLVNVATGRGKLSPIVSRVGAEFIWAPKLLASRVQLLTGQPFYTGTARTRAIVAKEYARAIAGGYLLYSVGRLFNEKQENDPTSSDFGKIVRGNVRIDPWGGFQQITVLGARTALAEKKTLKGAVQNMGIDRKYGVPSIWHVWADFGRSKLRPDVGVVTDILTRTDFQGKPVAPENVMAGLLVPLPLRDIVDVMKAQGFTEGMIIEALGQFGAGVAIYDQQQKKQHERQR